PQILDILKKSNAKATFFVLGEYVDSYPDIAKRIVSEGHAIGNHTYSHPDLRFMFKKGIVSEVKRAEDAILKATGENTFLFRPPYGGYNSRISRVIKNLGYVIVEYSVTAKDGGKTRIKHDAIVKAVLKKVENGSIILIHDGDRYTKDANKEEVVKALPIILSSLKGEGYYFVTVPELLHLKEGSDA
ncbi:MAG: polysaccharide deacetylase family protein, partial [Candidatus Omnitrophota bacterium]